MKRVIIDISSDPQCSSTWHISLFWLIIYSIYRYRFVECALAYTPSNCLDTTNTTPQNLEIILNKNTDARWMSTMVGLSLALGLFIIYFLGKACECFPDILFTILSSCTIYHLRMFTRTNQPKTQRSKNIFFILSHWRFISVYCKANFLHEICLAVKLNLVRRE
jgi:hypothetical protein